MSTPIIYSGQGPVYIGTFNSTLGVLANERSIGAANRVLKLSLERSTEKIKESDSGSRLDLAEYETEKSVNIELELQEFDSEMLALAMYGDDVAITGAAVSAETLPTVADGGFYHTRNPKISLVTVTDSAVTPATLTADTHYRIDDAVAGRLKFLDTDGFTQPFKVAYTFANRTRIKPFSETFIIRGLIFDGKSTADGTRVRVFLPRISFSPTADFDLLTDTAASLKLSGSLLLADIPDNDPVLGKFGTIDVL
jgi:hypothetical protein